MKHVTYADKSLLVGDEAANVLLAYAAVLARNNNADTVDIRAISSEGNSTTATFLLDAGAPLMAETINSPLPEPDNTDAVAYMREQMTRLSERPTGVPFDDRMPDHDGDFHF
ncbi:hypothetical protein [Planctomonas psychrotolerans]|uniref:hypothetical protein n=1 Tax=Planctomonas psychrotolerans TaxID=2528712 RepID=UPI00123A3771|nr:hypothetical protein [Planctomonas psychrotolerans]